jgi:hypothetical protein
MKTRQIPASHFREQNSATTSKNGNRKVLCSRELADFLVVVAELLLVVLRGLEY